MDEELRKGFDDAGFKWRLLCVGRPGTATEKPHGLGVRQPSADRERCLGNPEEVEHSDYIVQLRSNDRSLDTEDASRSVAEQIRTRDKDCLWLCTVELKGTSSSEVRKQVADLADALPGVLRLCKMEANAQPTVAVFAPGLTDRQRKALKASGALLVIDSQSERDGVGTPDELRRKLACRLQNWKWHPAGPPAPPSGFEHPKDIGGWRVGLSERDFQNAISVLSDKPVDFRAAKSR